MQHMAPMASDCVPRTQIPTNARKRKLLLEGDMVLHLDYTSRTLSTNTQWISTARSTFTRTKFVDWNLGRDEAIQWPKEIQY